MAEKSVEASACIGGLDRPLQARAGILRLDCPCGTTDSRLGLVSALMWGRILLPVASRELFFVAGRWGRPVGTITRGLRRPCRRARRKLASREQLGILSSPLRSLARTLLIDKTVDLVLQSWDKMRNHAVMPHPCPYQFIGMIQITGQLPAHFAVFPGLIRFLGDLSDPCHD